MKDFQLSRACDLDLDLGSSHTAYRRASIIDLYHMPNVIEAKENLLSTDERTYIQTYVRTDRRTDGRTFETHFIRWTQKSGPNKKTSPCSTGKWPLKPR